ncbi:MAG: aminotransferase class I/II-fold pyridoxal phosphate-dependent enzyme, partial [Burkholderiales bacterium]|nr:aminotransferase class I/II-fold pyridoxal phosphate-dependent enzyme [Burkholderiales bacterium]
ATGATGIEAPAKNFGHDLDAMLAAIRADTRLVFIANPNNPTGTLLADRGLRRFLESVPRSLLVVLDEAYAEYLPDDRDDVSDAHSDAHSIDWLREFPNLIITRTFSKAYGLAGLRIGFALANAGVADLMNRVRQPFNVSSVALAAAQAALADQDFVRESRRLNEAGMAQIVAGFMRLGIEYIPSYGNFVSFKVGDANAVYQRLLRLGVIVRPIANYGMPQYLRVSIGLEAENAKFLDELSRALDPGVRSHNG